MKKSLMGIAVALAVCCQPVVAQMRDGVDTLVVDMVDYRVTYNAKQVNDTANTPYLYQQAQMRLDIGKSVTRFYNLSYLQWTEQVKQMILGGGAIDLGKAQPIRCMLWEFYKNYPEQGKTLFLETVGGVHYQSIEDAETPSWQIMSDSVATIIGYNCQLAQAHFKGRVWYAWYAEDIPVPEGPWKLHGLPGLVLRAYDAQRQFCFEAVGLETLKGKEPLLYLKSERKAETISQADLVKIKQRNDNSQKYRDVKAFDKDGNPIKIKPKKNIFNPIER